MQIPKISVRTYYKDWWQAVTTLVLASRTGFSNLVRLDMSCLDWVGAHGNEWTHLLGFQWQDSPQINFTHPWYWFSVDGDCPNLLAPQCADVTMSRALQESEHPS